MPSIAKETDWKTEKMPGEFEHLDLQRTFSPQEFNLIRQGLIPREMEDKWFIYYESNLLNFHRSWTGHHIYKVAIEHQKDETYKVTQVVANRAKEQYNQEDNEYDVLLVNYLIDRFLLGRNIPFPMPAGLSTEKRTIYKHSMAGNATPNVAEKTPGRYTKITSWQRLQGCLAGGSIGDALGSFYEGQATIESVAFENLNGITDDTQLTLATCEAILVSGRVSPESIAKKMLEWYNKRKLTGLGASTLKALRDLQVGAHWGLSGRSGEYAAGNGAAMRIAPLAFFVNIETEKTLIKDVCNITHKNDEAYVGCLSILYALHYIITDQWLPDQNLLNLIASQLPDTSVRDNLLKLQENPTLSIREAARLIGTSGHVVESVPFSIFAAQKIRDRNFEDILSEIILCGGDTDTNASLAGNIMGAFIGLPGFSTKAMSTFRRIKEYDYILQLGDELAAMLQ